MGGSITIPSPVVPLISSSDFMIHGENYAFFDYSDHEMDLPTMYGDLLASAETKICIWDPYFNASKGDVEFNVFSKITKGLKIELLSHGSRTNTRVPDSIQRIKNNLDSTIVSSVQIDFFWISKDIHGSKYAVHDRFLIIDDFRFFLVGASWGYHSNIAGDRGATGIYEIKKESDKKVVNDMYIKYKRVAQIDGTVNRG